MATDFGALSTAQKKAWSVKIWKDGRDASFFLANGFHSTSPNTPIQLIDELTETERGDECVVSLVTDLQGDGVAGDMTLEGNEEALYNATQSIRIDQFRHGVRNRGRMSEQRTVLRFRATAKEKLGFWMGDKFDELAMLTLAGMAYTLKTDNSTRGTSSLPTLSFAADVVAPSTGRKIFPGTITATSSLTTSDTLNWSLVVKSQAAARRKRLRPIRAGGKEYYILVTSPEGLRDLKNSSDYQTNVGRAGDRGPNNPLFRNAVATIDGVVIYESNKLPNTLGLSSGAKWGAGSTVDGSQSLLMGAQALAFAEVTAPDFTESDQTDHGNSPAIGIRRMFGLLKPQFPSLTDLSGGAPTLQDFGVMSVYHAAAA